MACSRLFRAKINFQSRFEDLDLGVLATLSKIRILRSWFTGKWLAPALVCDCEKGVLATLSKFSDFVLVLQTTTLILIPGFQEMVTPRPGV
jgi:hypothetical protein